LNDEGPPFHMEEPAALEKFELMLDGRCMCCGECCCMQFKVKPGRLQY
jgi:hypothetical protein